MLQYYQFVLDEKLLLNYWYLQLLEIALLGFWRTLCSDLQGCFYRIFRDYEVPTHLPLLLYFDGLIGLYDVSPDDYMNKYAVAKFDKIIRYVSNAKILIYLC